MKQIKLMNASGIDVDTLLDIDYECYEEPWTKTQFLQALKKDKVVVAKNGTKIVGYIVYFIDVSGDVEIFNIALIDNYRRCGIGTLMMNMIENLHPGRIMISVIETNLGAHLFLRALGYTCTKILHGDYLSELYGPTNCYLFEKEVSQPA